MQPPPNLLGTYNGDLQKSPVPTDFLLVPFALTVLLPIKGSTSIELKKQVPRGRNSEYALITSKRTLLGYGNRCLSRPFSTNSPKNERLAGRTWLFKVVLSLKPAIQHAQIQPSGFKKPCKKQIFSSQPLIHQLCIQRTAC